MCVCVPGCSCVCVFEQCGSKAIKLLTHKGLTTATSKLLILISHSSVCVCVCV